MLETIQEIVRSGSCSGCGACAISEPNSLVMTKKPNGIFLPTSISAKSSGNLARTCPFSSNLPITRKQIGKSKAGEFYLENDLVGSYVYLGAGRIVSEEIWSSSSGGLTTWLLEQLLETGEVDGVIHLGESERTSDLFEYRISKTIAEITANRGSKYYAATFQHALEEIRADNLRYAFVGVPCFVNAVDLLRHDDEVWRRKIAFTLGLVCGHLKTQIYTETLARQLGVESIDIASVDYRIKNPNYKSSDYSFGVKSKASGMWRSTRVKNLVASNWGEAAFSLEACNSCTDIFAYSSDVTFGDAWLKRFENESRGTNLVVVRNPRIQEILQAGNVGKEIYLEELTELDVLESQKGGIRHRVQGYLVRNSAGQRKVSPQSDFESVPAPAILRSLLLRYRSFLSRVTRNQVSFAGQKDFEKKLKIYRYLVLVFRVFDLLSKLSFKKLIAKITLRKI